MTVHTLYLPERVAQARLDFALRHRRLTRTRVASSGTAHVKRVSPMQSADCGGKKSTVIIMADFVEVNVMSDLEGDLHLTLTFRDHEDYL